MAFVDNLEALVQKFAPLLRLHPEEINLPGNVTDYASQVEYVESNGTVHAPGWSWSAMLREEGDYLQIPAANAKVIEAGNLATAQVYVHATTVKGVPTQIDLQYWIFYPFNGSETMRVEGWAGGSTEQLTELSWHQGDWEVVKVRVDSTESIVAVYMSEHSGGVWLPRAPGNDPSAGYSVVNDTHPIAYVAQGSHAHYPSAGGPYEIGSCDLKAIEILMVDYTADGGPDYDLSQPGRCVIVANDCPGIFSYEPDASVTGWLTFQGEWGAPIQPLSPAGIVDAVGAILSQMAGVGGILGKAIGIAAAYLVSGPFIGISVVASLLGSLFGSEFYSKDGPRNPTVQGSWSSAPPVLFWGKDVPLFSSDSASTFCQVALTGSSNSLGECYFPQQPIPSPSPTTVRWATLQAGSWLDRGALAGVQAQGAVAVGVDPSSGTGILTSCVNQKLLAWSTSFLESGSWQSLGNFPAFAAVSAAAFAMFGGKWVGVYVSTTSDDPSAAHQLTFITSCDLKTWAGPTPIEGSSCSIPSFSGWVPSAVVFNGLLLVAFTAQPISGAPGPEVMIVAFDGENWGPPLGIGGAYAYSGGACLAVVDGTLVCSFADTKKQVRYATSEDGVNWSQAGALPTALSAAAPAISIVGSELVCVHPGQGHPELWWNSASPSS